MIGKGGTEKGNWSSKKTREDWEGRKGTGKEVEREGSWCREGRNRLGKQREEREEWEKR